MEQNVFKHWHLLESQEVKVSSFIRSVRTLCLEEIIELRTCVQLVLKSLIVYSSENNQTEKPLNFKLWNLTSNNSFKSLNIKKRKWRFLEDSTTVQISIDVFLESAYFWIVTILVIKYLQVCGVLFFIEVYK